MQYSNGIILVPTIEIEKNNNLTVDIILGFNLDYHHFQSSKTKNSFHSITLANLEFEYFAEMPLVKSSVYIIFCKSYQFQIVREQRNIYIKIEVYRVCVK